MSSVWQGLCFDLDGTLLDSWKTAPERIAKVASSMRLPVTRKIKQQIQDLWDVEALQLISTIWPNADPNEFFSAWDNLDISNPHHLFPGVRQTIELLSWHYPLSILTNRHSRTVLPQLESNDLSGFFGLVSTPDSSGFTKPNPRSADGLVSWYTTLGISKENIIMIGDTIEADWGLAKALELEFYGVTSGGADTKAKFLATGVPEDHILGSVSELPKVLLKTA